MNTPYHLILGVLLFLGLPAGAFPPAPSYALYGIVRDQVGQRVVASGAELVIYRGTEEIGRTPLTGNSFPDQNYELRVSIDANRPSTELYRAKAIASDGAFHLAVEMNGSIFYPIETSGGLTAGKGGERVHLDLNLGIDSDGDGLPDTWEEWQLYLAGHFPDENGDWPLHLLDRDGDFDNDGRSNWLEYIAGTYAGDRSDYFKIEIMEVSEEQVRIEFYGITGKTYTLESSEDGETWVGVPMALSEEDELFNAHTSTTVGIFSAFSARPAGDKQLYRMNVR